jgi:protease-4
MSEVARPRAWPSPGVIALWVLLPLALGILLACLIPRPIIGLIHLDDAIYSYSARELIAQIDFARSRSEVRAVVLVFDSPGGTVADTEAVYMEIARLRQSKPVVTMVQGMAASGAFYLSVGTDHILAGPSSSVGNVGVIAELPAPPVLQEDLATTGPYKVAGTPRDTLLREMEMIKQGFYQAVIMGRGERLQIGPEILLSGQIWTGSEALRLGLIDGLGSQSDAVEKAAQMAHVGHYRVADLRDLAALPESYSDPFFYETPEGLLTHYPKKPGVYLLYIPPTERRLP